MPSGIVESAVWTPFIYSPEDGEAADKDSVKDNFIQGLTNRTAYLHQPAASGSAQYPLKERNLVRFVSAVPFVSPSASWSMGSLLQWTTSVTTASYLWFPVDVPNGCLVTGFQAIVTGGAGHTASLPTTMPTLRFYMLDLNGSITSYGEKIDPSADKAAFELRHPIVMSGVTAVAIDKSMYRPYLKFESESDTGSNARAGLIVHSVAVLFTVTEQDPGAG